MAASAVKGGFMQAKSRLLKRLANQLILFPVDSFVASVGSHSFGYFESGWNVEVAVQGIKCVV